MLRTTNLTKKYQTDTALDNLNLTVQAGEIFCLLGANGAGKTTTINLFMNFIQPTEGQVFINGLEVSQQAQATKKYLAYIPENLNLYGNLTGLENLQFFAGLSGEQPTQETAAQLLQSVGLQTAAINKRVAAYSKGMRQKVGIAIAEAKRADNLLLDEPTSGLDPPSLSNGLLRFGEISAALILQLLVPLLIFFWGFALIAGERETGTLRLVLSQGVSWSELIIGKSLGLFLLSLTMFLPTILLALILLFFSDFTSNIFLNFGLLSVSYLTYLGIMSLLAIWVSARSQTAKTALIQLIGCWLFFTLLLPKLSQVSGQVFFPTPSKIEFDTAVEHELIELGDSHDPDDPHFKGIKDSLLAVYQVSSTQELPFNYSGFIMKEGERLSTEVFRRHQAELLERYEQQQNIVRWTAFFNPYIAIKNVSMAFAGTDFFAFRNFQNQTEDYRYNLAQTMNDWQIKFIKNNTSSSDKGAVISRQYWKDFADFEHKHLGFTEVVRNEWMSLLALLLWLTGLVFLANFSTKNLKAF